MKATLSDIKEVRKVGRLRHRDRDRRPVPDLARRHFAHHDHEQASGARRTRRLTPVDRRKGIENAASFKTNGTGPFRVRERQPDVRTVFTRNGTYWGKIEGNAQEVIFTPISNPSTRVAALISGEVDVMEPVPVQDIARINASPAAKRDRRRRAAHHLPGHGPEARRAAVLQHQGQEPVQGQARAPGVLPGDRHQRHPAHRDARRLAPDGAAGRPRHQRLDRRAGQAPAVRHRSRQEADGRRRLPGRLRSDDELPERSLRERRPDLPERGFASLAKHQRQGQPRDRNQAARTSRRSCVATPASICWAGRRRPTTRTTR